MYEHLFSDVVSEQPPLIYTYLLMQQLIQIQILFRICRKALTLMSLRFGNGSKCDLSVHDELNIFLWSFDIYKLLWGTWYFFKQMRTVLFLLETCSKGRSQNWYFVPTVWPEWSGPGNTGSLHPHGWWGLPAESHWSGGATVWTSPGSVHHAPAQFQHHHQLLPAPGPLHLRQQELP